MSQKYSQDEAQALVKALKEGNQLAFSIVYKTYAAQTFSLAFKYLLNKELAEDAVQNLFLTYIIHSGFISGYQNRYGDNLKPPTNVYHRMTA